MLFRLVSSVLVGLLIVPTANAMECKASSGPNRVALLELYTSEGCSSCPPADQWVSQLVKQGFTPNKVVPLAFHVDYWDYIGWPDRFAKPAFSQRQRQRVSASGGRVVYTPQVMLNGRDYREWRFLGLAFSLDGFNSKPAGADIDLALNTAAAGQLQISAHGKSKSAQAAEMYVAVYQNDLTSNVSAGENSGEKLHHDYVVREWYGPIPVGSPWQQRVAFKPDWKASDMGVAAFVQERGSGELLQALQLKMCI